MTVTHLESHANLPESREWHYSKAINILSRNVWNVVLLDAGCTPHLAKTFSRTVKVELVAHHQLYPCHIFVLLYKGLNTLHVKLFSLLSCMLPYYSHLFSPSSKNQPRVWKQLALIFFEWFLLELKTRFE